MTNVEAAAARFVVMAMSPRFSDAAVVEPQLNPNQQNQRMNTPEGTERNVVPGDGVRRPVAVVFSETRSDDLRSDEGAYAADHMDGR